MTRRVTKNPPKAADNVLVGHFAPRVEPSERPAAVARSAVVPAAIAPPELLSGAGMPRARLRSEPAHAGLSGIADFVFFGGNRGVTVRGKRLELDAMPAGILTELHAYWRAKCVGGRLPSRALIDPLDFRAALGRICLLEVLRAPLRFRYRLDGSLIAEHRGYDMTGRTTDEVLPPALADILRAQYSHVAETALPAYFEVTFSRSPDEATYRGLALPLSSTGAEVDMILACAQGSEVAQKFIFN